MPSLAEQLTALGLPPDLPITEPEFKFCTEFHRSGQVKAALQAAGWKYAPLNLAGRPGVKALMAHLEATRAAAPSSPVVDKSERERLLSELARGNPTVAGGMPPTVGEQMKAIELLAKMQGDFSDAPQVNLPPYIVPMPPRINDPMEWARLAQQAIKMRDVEVEKVETAP